MAQAPFYIWKVGDTEYKLRIDTASGIELENKLNMTLVQILDSLGSLKVIATFLWSALQKYHHSTDMEKVYALYDAYIDEGNTLEDIMAVVVGVFQSSGFIKQEQVVEAKKAGKATKA